MQNIKTALSAGQAVAKNESATVGNSGRVGGDPGKADSSNCAAASAAAVADKVFATLRAEMALAGFELDVISDGTDGQTYLVKRWNLRKELPDLASVRAFGCRGGVKP